jgi:hypothetical protein
MGTGPGRGAANRNKLVLGQTFEATREVPLRAKGEDEHQYVWSHHDVTGNIHVGHRDVSSNFGLGNS